MTNIESRTALSVHTPAPWGVLEWADEKKGFIAVVGPAEPAQHICDVFPFGKRAEGQTLGEHTANARLIAAAPDMLTALQMVMAEWREGYGLRCEDEVRAAIAKATGTQSSTERKDG